jgi:hypothetical protein
MKKIFEARLNNMIRLIATAPTESVLTYRAGKAAGMIHLADDLEIIDKKDAAKTMINVLDVESHRRGQLREPPTE